MASTSIDSLLSAVQPLVFETGAEEIPYATAGTVFLVAYAGDWYVCTTRHGLYAESPPPICVFPNDLSRRIFKLGNVFFVPREDESEYFVDFAIIDIDPTFRNDPELAAAKPFNLEALQDQQAGSVISGQNLYVVGYPNEMSTIEYEGDLLKTDRIVLRGICEGQAQLDHLYTMRVTEQHNLVSFSGLSGGPVFAARKNSSPDEDSTPFLCGMAILGNSRSNLVHFLPIEILIHAIKVKRLQDGYDDA